MYLNLSNVQYYCCVSSTNLGHLVLTMNVEYEVHVLKVGDFLHEVDSLEAIKMEKKLRLIFIIFV